MLFADKVRRSSAHPGIKVKEVPDYPGVDVAFFERDGGVSEDRRVDGKLIGVYAGLNVFTVGKRAFPEGSAEQLRYMRAVAENICKAADFVGSDAKQLTVLESRYGKGDGPHIVNKASLEESTFYEVVSPEVKIRKRAGDVIMTDDPDTPIAIVGADAHPIAIKATKPDGKPAVCLVVGSHQGLLEHGIMERAIEAMREAYEIDVATIQIDIGPGLGPDSISGYNKDEGRYSSTSYEVGMDLAEKYILASRDVKSPYYGKRLKFFDAAAERADTCRPIFSAHPSDAKKCVIDIEALVQQTAAFSGVGPEKINAVGQGNFFTARGMVKQLDLEAFARSHPRVIELAKEQGMTPEEFIAKPQSTIYRNDGMGRNIFIARVLNVDGARPHL